MSVSGFAEYQKPPDFTCPEFGVYPCNCTAESDDGIAILCENTNLASMAVGLREGFKKILKMYKCDLGGESKLVNSHTFFVFISFQIQPKCGEFHTFLIFFFELFPKAGGWCEDRQPHHRQLQHGEAVW